MTQLDLTSTNPNVIRNGTMLFRTSSDWSGHRDDNSSDDHDLGRRSRSHRPSQTSRGPSAALRRLGEILAAASQVDHVKPVMMAGPNGHPIWS